MNIRTFWNILLKIIGIFLVINGVVVCMQALAFFSAAIQGNEIDNGFFYIVLTLLGTLLLYFFILWLFVFKTSWLIDKLDLEKGFNEERIDLKNDFSTIITIAIIVIGGVTFLDALPVLCKHVFVYYQEKSIRFVESPTASWIIIYAIKTTIGYLLMTNSKQITAFIYRKSNKKEESNNENL